MDATVKRDRMIRDATLLNRCEEFTGSAAKVVTPMRAMTTDCIHVFGTTRDMAK
jgi:hypothetical protein